MKLFELGAHRGNSKSKLNSKLRSCIHSYMNDITIIDLVKTITSIESSVKYLKYLGQRKKQVLVVGTSNHIKHLVPGIASKFSTGTMPYVNSRWLGGTLTNWTTIKRTLKTYSKLESIESNEEFFSKLAKNEQLRIKKQKAKIGRFFGGLTDLKNNRPGALLVLDIDDNPIAIKEANLKNIPVIGLTNTKANVLPKKLNTTIVCNINSINAVEFILDILVEAYNEGLKEGVASQMQKLGEEKKLENKIKKD